MHHGGIRLPGPAPGAPRTCRWFARGERRLPSAPAGRRARSRDTLSETRSQTRAFVLQDPLQKAGNLRYGHLGERPVCKAAAKGLSQVKRQDGAGRGPGAPASGVRSTPGAGGRFVDVVTTAKAHWAQTRGPDMRRQPFVHHLSLLFRGMIDHRHSEESGERPSARSSCSFPIVRLLTSAPLAPFPRATRFRTAHGGPRHREAGSLAQDHTVLRAGVRDPHSGPGMP